MKGPLYANFENFVTTFHHGLIKNKSALTNPLRCFRYIYGSLDNNLSIIAFSKPDRLC